MKILQVQVVHFVWWTAHMKNAVAFSIQISIPLENWIPKELLLASDPSCICEAPLAKSEHNMMWETVENIRILW